MVFSRCRLMYAFAVSVLISSTRAYRLTWQLRGNDFLNQFDYWDSGSANDPTSSSDAPTAAYYMPKSAAQQQGLVYVTGEGNFHLGVDSTFAYSGSNLRPSVRITSRKTIYKGLLIIDAPHLPAANGAWPAIWTDGADGQWPGSGEIDIYEGVNNAQQNTMSYHTSSGCYYDTNAQQTGFLSDFGTDCNALDNNDQACGNVDPNTASYGDGANEGGGSVYAMEWTDDGIKMWHFNRYNVPGDISRGRPNPAGWGTPVTNLASTYCDLDSYFAEQVLIINIDLCGTWAGVVYPGGPWACMDYVQSHPEAFEDAYFEIASVTYYQ